MHKLQKIPLILTSVLIVILIALGFLFWQNQQNKLQVYFLNVGQGDAIFIKTPSHQRILIDGGPDNRVLAELGKHLPFYNQKIDLVILTHPDADHLTGLVEVLKRYPVKKVLTSGVVCNNPLCEAWSEVIKEKNIETQIAQTGQIFDFSETRLKILHPLINLNQQIIEETNDASVVTKLVYRNNSFLLTGDATVAVEAALLAAKADLRADVLKVSHHGSDTASSEEFLSAVQPRWAVISVGENKFGLPSRRILYRLERIAAAILRTDEWGEVKFIGDGRALQVKY